MNKIKPIFTIEFNNPFGIIDNNYVKNIDDLNYLFGNQIIKQLTTKCNTVKTKKFVKYKKHKNILFGKNNIKIINYNYRRNLSSEYCRGLINKCNQAENKIFDILSNVTDGSFIKICDDEPLRINNPAISWDKDESPIDFLHLIEKYPEELQILLDVLERSITNLNKKETITISLNSIRSFQGFLTISICKPIIRCKVYKTISIYNIYETNKEELDDEYNNLLVSINSFSINEFEFY
jgi:hypothetical protein